MADSSQPDVQQNESILENSINNNCYLQNSKITNEIILNDFYTCDMCNEKMKLQFYLKEHFEKCLENFLNKKPKNYVANNFLLFVKANLTILPRNEMTEILEKVGYTWDDVNNATVVLIPPPIRREDINSRNFNENIRGNSFRNIFS